MNERSKDYAILGTVFAEIYLFCSDSWRGHRHRPTARCAGDSAAIIIMRIYVAEIDRGRADTIRRERLRLFVRAFGMANGPRLCIHSLLATCEEALSIAFK